MFAKPNAAILLGRLLKPNQQKIVDKEEIHRTGNRAYP